MFPYHMWKAHLVTAFPPKVFTCRVPQSNLKRRYGNQPAEFKWIQVSRVVSRPGIRRLQHETTRKRLQSCVQWTEVSWCVCLRYIQTRFSKTSQAWSWDYAKVRESSWNTRFPISTKTAALPSCSLQCLLVAYGVRGKVLIKYFGVLLGSWLFESK